jgi:putative addiction module component (TIGR02574 family)
VAMAASLHELAAQAFELDPADRLRLAAELIDSVEGSADPEWTSEWRDELRRRSEAADARVVRGAEWTEVRARLLEELGKK